MRGDKFRPVSSAKSDFMPGKPRHIEDIYQPFPLMRRTPLSRAFPEVAAQWDHKRNCGFGPEEFSFGSNVLVWWRCPEGSDHVFKAPITGVVRAFRSGNNGCSFCDNKKLSVTNSLASVRPDLAKEFMEKRNGKRAKDVVAGGITRY